MKERNLEGPVVSSPSGWKMHVPTWGLCRGYTVWVGTKIQCLTSKKPGLEIQSWRPNTPTAQSHDLLRPTREYLEKEEAKGPSLRLGCWV